jgi:hypothetical protein
MTMCSPCADTALPVPGLPIRESTDQRLFNTSPWLIAVVHALHRLLVPRHPPCALDILTVIDPLEPKLVGIDETQFLNWPAVQFSRSGRGADRAPVGGKRPLGRRSRLTAAGLSKLSSARAPAPFEWIRLRRATRWWPPNSCCTTRSGRHS